MTIWSKITSFFGATPKPAPRPETKPAPTVKAPHPRAEPAPAAVPLTRNELARCYYQAQMWNTLLAFKRKQKKGWAALGFSTAEERVIRQRTGG